MTLKYFFDNMYVHGNNVKIIGELIKRENEEHDNYEVVYHNGRLDNCLPEYQKWLFSLGLNIKRYSVETIRYL